MATSEIELDSPAIRALGTRFNFTEVFLRDDGFSSDNRQASSLPKHIRFKYDSDDDNVDGNKGEISLNACPETLGSADQYYLKWGVPLHRSAMESDWKTAERILHQHPNLATASVDIDGGNVLHVACGANSRTHFIKQLVANYMNTPDDLALPDSKDRSTCLMYLASSGNNVRAAKFIIKKNESLPLMKDDVGYYAVTYATNWGNGKMASYLLSVTNLHQVPTADRF